MHAFNRSVGRRLTALTIIMIIVISSVMMLIGYVRFSQTIEEYYRRLGETTAGIIALIVDPDSLEYYLNNPVADEKFNTTMDLIINAGEECEAQALYVFTLGEQDGEPGIFYVYDTDTTDMRANIGDFDPFIQGANEKTGAVDFLYPPETEKQLRDGGSVDTIIGVTYYGWTITVNEPLYGSDGLCKGYVGVDFDVNQVNAERMVYLVQVGTVIIITTVMFAVIYLLIIRRSIINPINIMAKATNDFVLNEFNSEGNAAILSMEVNTKDELNSLSEALKSMVLKIDEHIASLRIATQKAETDVLTSINNRGAFEQQVTGILNLRPEKGVMHAFMMIDVDFFKYVNDAHGHAVGDMVLTECAKALKSVTRNSDVVGRLGGDEFAVFCTNIGSVANAEDKARQIRAAWQKILLPDGKKRITGSIGISFTPPEGAVYQDIFNNADIALYRAKEAGRDGYSCILNDKTET
ncbi:hypothetical protein FACS1894219_07150 [Clostridia bacterium]|nr:hypothetical protein FACS1894219_07150 [Clostridia bacterium]